MGNRIFEVIEEQWNNNRWIASFLVLISAGIALWLLVRPHSPGWSIGILAGAAGIMSLRPQMHTAEKIAWILLLVLFVVLEMESIKRADEASSAARDAQNRRFADIAQGIQDSYKQSQDQFSKTMDTLKPTLQAATTTLKPTQPHALLRFIEDFSGTPPSTLVRNPTSLELHFNSSYINDGDQDARLLRKYIGFYVARPDDSADQQKLEEQFEQTWKNVKRTAQSETISQKETGFSSAERVFSADEMQRIKNRETIYILRRMEYRDITGTWYSDRCDDFQISHGTFDIDNSRQMGVAHRCAVLMRKRYPARLR